MQTHPPVARPRFRHDLVAQPIEEEGVRYVDVTDPRSGATFRFYDVEYSIACAMDGAKDLPGLAAWTRSELGIDTSPDELAGVVNTLHELGYLAPEAERAESAPAGLELGAPGASDVATETAREVSKAYDEVMELGPPGASTVAPLPTPPAVAAPELELGPPGSFTAGQAGDEIEATRELDLSRVEQAAQDIDQEATRELSLGHQDAESVDGEEPREEATRIVDGMSMAAREIDAAAADREITNVRAAPTRPSKPVAVQDSVAVGSLPGKETDFGGLMDDEQRDLPTPPPVPSPAAFRAETVREESFAEVASTFGTAGRPDDVDEPTLLPPPASMDDDVGVDLSGQLGRTSAIQEIEPEQGPEFLPEPSEITDLATLASAARSSRPPPPPPIPVDSPSLAKTMLAPTPSGLPGVAPLAAASVPGPSGAISLADAPPRFPKLSPASPSPGMPVAPEPADAVRVPVPGSKVRGARPKVMIGLGVIGLVAAAATVWFKVSSPTGAALGPARGLQRPAATVAQAAPSDPPAPAATDVAPSRAAEPATAPTTRAGAVSGPVLPSAKLVGSSAASVEITAPSAGVLEWVIDDGDTVARDEVVAKLAGAKKWESAIGKVEDRLTFYQDALTRAQESGNTADASAKEKKVLEKKNILAVARKKLEPLLVKSPEGGLVKVLKPVGARVSARDAIVKLGAVASGLSATFELAGGGPAYKASAPCVVASRASRDKQLPCVIESVAANKVKIRLVAGAAALAGDDIVLLPPR